MGYDKLVLGMKKMARYQVNEHSDEDLFPSLRCSMVEQNHLTLFGRPSEIEKDILLWWGVVGYSCVFMHVHEHVCSCVYMCL